MKYYLVAEVAKTLRLSESQVYALIGSGRLRCHRLTTGKQGGIRISDEQLRDYLTSTEEQAALPQGVKHLR
jgi:excisionase family DNA binding protein